MIDETSAPWTRRAIPLLILALLGPWAVLSATAETIESRMEYRTCLTPGQGQARGGAGKRPSPGAPLGGGEPARHCAAVALIGLGKYEEAAKRLEALAELSRRPRKCPRRDCWPRRGRPGCWRACRKRPWPTRTPG